MTSYSFIRRLPGGSTYCLGTAVQYPEGWRFLSNVDAYKNSRKFHATMEKCIPRWVGYPDRCESVEVTPRGEYVVDPWRRDDPYPGATERSADNLKQAYAAVTRVGEAV